MRAHAPPPLIMGALPIPNATHGGPPLITGGLPLIAGALPSNATLAPASPSRPVRVLPRARLPPLSLPPLAGSGCNRLAAGAAEPRRLAPECQTPDESRHSGAKRRCRRACRGDAKASLWRGGVPAGLVRACR